MLGLFERLEHPEHPRQALAVASMFVGGLGVVLSVIGLIAMLVAFASGDEAGRFGHTLRGLMALVGWLIPGLVYVACAWGIRHRKRWAPQTAEVNTFVQMFFAGAMVVLSILQIKLMWPYMIAGLVWVIPLLVVPKFTGPCDRAMDQIAQLPEMAVDPTGRGRRA